MNPVEGKEKTILLKLSILSKECRPFKEIGGFRYHKRKVEVE